MSRFGKLPTALARALVLASLRAIAVEEAELAERHSMEVDYRLRAGADVIATIDPAAIAQNKSSVPYWLRD